MYFGSKYLKQYWSTISKGLKKNKRGNGIFKHPNFKRKRYVVQDCKKNTLVYLHIHFASIAENKSF